MVLRLPTRGLATAPTEITRFPIMKQSERYLEDVPSAKIIMRIKGEEEKVAAIPPTLKSSLDDKMKRSPTYLIKKR
jgi:hypothetical protein